MGKHKTHYYEPRDCYLTVRELARLPEVAEGVTGHILSNRIAMGWDAKEAVLTPNKGRKAKKVHSRSYLCNYRGKKIPLKKIWEQHAVDGLPYHVFYIRVQRKDWDLDEALNTPLMEYVERGKRKAKKYEFHGKMMSISDLLADPHCQITSRITMYYRLEVQHWTVYTAVMTPPKYSWKDDPLSREERDFWNKWLSEPEKQQNERIMKQWEDESLLHASELHSAYKRFVK